MKPNTVKKFFLLALIGASVSLRAETVTKVLPIATRIEFRVAKDTAQKGLESFAVEGMSDKIFIAPRPVMTNIDVASAQAKALPTGLQVDLKLTAKGQEKLIRTAARHDGQWLVLFVNNRLISTLVIGDALKTASMLHFSSTMNNNDADATASAINNNFQGNH